MIKHLETNIFSLTVDGIVNPVNCIGVSGAGLARKFKDVFSDNQRQYEQFCREGKMRLGQVFVTEVPKGPRPGRHDSRPNSAAVIRQHKVKYVINFPTKNHWRDDSTLEIIVAGLPSLRDAIERLDLRSVAIPALGCGLGGLQWAGVEPLIRQHLDGLTARVYLIPPLKQPVKQANRIKKRGAML